MRIDHSKHSTSKDSLLKRVEKSDQKRKEAKEKRTFVHLMHRLGPLKEHFMKDDRNGMEPEPLKFIPHGYIT